VEDLATRLRSDTVDVVLDKWHLVPGDQLTEFMERSIRESEFILIVCTPRYRAKANNRIGGVGYEENIITAEVLTTGNERKFIPILREGTWEDAAPTWLLGKYRIDLSGHPYAEYEYTNLIDTLLGRRAGPPPIGTAQKLESHSGSTDDVSSLLGKPLPPIRIQTKDGNWHDANVQLSFHFDVEMAAAVLAHFGSVEAAIRETGFAASRLLAESALTMEDKNELIAGIPMANASIKGQLIEMFGKLGVSIQSLSITGINSIEFRK
jgi:hypothetical protein